MIKFKLIFNYILLLDKFTSLKKVNGNGLVGIFRITNILFIKGLQPFNLNIIRVPITKLVLTTSYLHPIHLIFNNIVYF